MQRREFGLAALAAFFSIPTLAIASKQEKQNDIKEITKVPDDSAQTVTINADKIKMLGVEFFVDDNGYVKILGKDGTITTIAVP